MNKLLFVSLIVTCLLVGMPAFAADPVPDACFDTIDGGQADLRSLEGQVVVLNLWAVWCSPCLIEIPHLVRLQPKLEDVGATVVGLAVDSGSASAIQRFWTHRLEIEPVYPLWKTTADEAGELFQARTYPTTLIIDREGQVRETMLGLQTGEDLLAAVEPYL
ncbi:TlpA family protein disulfide reductase [Wenzhouxiangella sp. AB-CW3]|uniref:TlpA family protein disulfide reductase n=1 Tax=Wenzhouxiangella sp. AB-CW3 TaxID=2771012 RepID=UPI00168ACD0C|nr:TlpA disulfide reductase family protein [Wenzhouxiangella sp. AB-CW3]QOC22464.1 TlpA family protein disulfide reductase [Wenzhouxiangella sp. AB-CW3]